jgi:hypothetical protein
MTPEQEAEAAAARAAALQDEIKQRQLLNSLTLKQLEHIRDSSDPAIYNQIKDANESLIKQIERNINLLQDSMTEYQRISLDATKAARIRAKAEIDAKQAEIDLYEELVKQGKASVDQLRTKREELENLQEGLEKATKAAEDLYSAFGDLLKGDIVSGLKTIGKMLMSTMGPDITSKIKDGLLDITTTIGRGGAGAAGLTAGLIGFGAALAVVGVTLSIFKKMFDLAVAVVDASNAFQKATGTSNEFASSLITVGNEVRRFGGTVEEVSASFQSLFTNVSDFTMMSKASREELIKTNTVLSKLGIANDDLAKSQQFMIKTMGQSAEQAAATSRELAAFASDIGVAPSKMMSDLASAGPQLAKFGRDATSTFKDLAQTAKITGIEINRLLAITDKFDTFDGAAEQAGRLNAALGGNFVNAMELLTETDPTKRFEMMTGAIKDAGKSFDEMTYFEAKFFAEAMGLSDVSELAMALSGNMDQVGKFTKKSSAEYEALAARAAKVQSFQEKMNMLMAQLVPIVEPLVDALMGISDWMAENMGIVKVAFTLLIGLATGLAVAMTAVAIATAAATLPFWATALAIGAAIAAVTTLGYWLFVHPWGSNFGEATAALGENTSFLGSSFLSMAEDVISAEAAINKFGNATFKGNGNLKVGTEMTTKSIQDMNVAMKDASVGPASARTEANAYNMSQVGDTITTNTQQYMGTREPINVNLNVDGKKMAMATVGPMVQSAAMK